MVWEKKIRKVQCGKSWSYDLMKIYSLLPSCVLYPFFGRFRLSGNLDNSNTNALLGHPRIGKQDPGAQARLLVWHPLRLWVFTVSSMSPSQFLVTSSTMAVAYSAHLLTCSPQLRLLKYPELSPHYGWRVTSGLTGKCGHSHQQWLEPQLCWGCLDLTVTIASLSPGPCSLPCSFPSQAKTRQNRKELEVQFFRCHVFPSSTQGPC